MTVQWWKTPAAQGGGGQDNTKVTQKNIAEWIGFDGTSFQNTVPSDNGSFKVTAVVTTAGSEAVTIVGLGKEKRGTNYPLITSTVTLATGSISTTVSSGTGFPTGS